jgi:hypothetical protein
MVSSFSLDSVFLKFTGVAFKFWLLAFNGSDLFKKLVDLVIEPRSVFLSFEGILLGLKLGLEKDREHKFITTS